MEKPEANEFHLLQAISNLSFLDPQKWRKNASMLIFFLTLWALLWEDVNKATSISPPVDVHGLFTQFPRKTDSYTGVKTPYERSQRWINMHSTLDGILGSREESS